MDNDLSLSALLKIAGEESADPVKKQKKSTYGFYSGSRFIYQKLISQ